MCRVVDLSDGKIYVKPENNNSAFKSVIFEIVQVTNICKVQNVSYSRTGFTVQKLIASTIHRLIGKTTTCPVALDNSLMGDHLNLSEHLGYSSISRPMDPGWFVPLIPFKKPPKVHYLVPQLHRLFMLKTVATLSDCKAVEFPITLENPIICATQEVTTAVRNGSIIVLRQKPLHSGPVGDSIHERKAFAVSTQQFQKEFKALKEREIEALEEIEALKKRLCKASPQMHFEDMTHDIHYDQDDLWGAGLSTLQKKASTLTPIDILMDKSRVNKHDSQTSELTKTPAKNGSYADDIYIYPEGGCFSDCDSEFPSNNSFKDAGSTQRKRVTFESKKSSRLVDPNPNPNPSSSSEGGMDVVKHKKASTLTPIDQSMDKRDSIGSSSSSIVHNAKKDYNNLFIVDVKLDKVSVKSKGKNDEEEKEKEGGRKMFSYMDIVLLVEKVCLNGYGSIDLREKKKYSELVNSEHEAIKVSETEKNTIVDFELLKRDALQRDKEVEIKRKQTYSKRKHFCLQDTRSLTTPSVDPNPNPNPNTNPNPNPNSNLDPQQENQH
jgi:hypothetical protein